MRGIKMQFCEIVKNHNVTFLLEFSIDVTSAPLQCNNAVNYITIKCIIQ